MTKLAGFVVVLLSVIGVSAAQNRHDSHPYHRPEPRREQRDEHRDRSEHRQRDYREHRNYTHHREGFRFQVYRYVGPHYAHPWRNWDHHFLTLWDSSRWYISDIDIWIVEGWYVSDPVYVYLDDAHYGWYLLYNARTGQTVHAEYWP